MSRPLPSSPLYRRLPARRDYIPWTEKQKRWGFRLFISAAGWVLWAFTRLWLGSCRWTVLGGPHFTEFQGAGRPILYATWHRSIPVLFYLCWDVNAAIMASRSDDGQLAAELIRRNRCNPVGGSSSRGGREALDELVEFARAGYVCALMSDGPKGPPRRCKMGILSLAQKTGVPIIPLVASADRQWALRNWDGTRFPKPFSRIVIHYGAPTHIPPDLTPEQMEVERLRLEERMNLMQEELDRFFQKAPTGIVA